MVVQARRRIEQSPLSNSPPVPKSTVGTVEDEDGCSGDLLVDFGDSYGVVICSPDEIELRSLPLWVARRVLTKQKGRKNMSHSKTTEEKPQTKEPKEELVKIKKTKHEKEKAKEKEAKKEKPNLLGAFKKLVKSRHDKGTPLGTKDEIVSRIRKDIPLNDVREDLLRFYVSKAKAGKIGGCHVLSEKDGVYSATDKVAGKAQQ